MKMVNTMKDGSTLRDLANHPAFLALEATMKKNPIDQNLTNNKTQKNVDVFSAFKQTYVEPEEIELAERIRNWAISMAKEKLRNETHPFAKTPEQMLVKTCQSYPWFWNRYSRLESWTPGWKCTQRGDPSSPVKLVSLDCEMVTVGEILQVVRVCAVDSDYNTLVDEFVLPDGKVTNFYTNIHGISENDLQGVTVTQADAQELVMSILTPGTILVGHSLYNDLHVLRIDHKRVIDVALLLTDLRKPLNNFISPPQLRRAILPDHEFRNEGTDPHDCLQDAIVPMKLVQYRLEQGAEHVRNLILAGTEPPPPVADGFDIPLDSYPRAAGKQCNRLPGDAVFMQCTSRAIQSLMLAQAEAEARGKPEVGTELLLLGLNIAELRGPSEVTIREVVNNLFHETVELNFVQPSSEHVTPFSHGSKRVLEAALQQMKMMGHKDIEPEHIVIALLLVDDGGASKVLDRLGVKKGKLRKKAWQCLFQNPC